MRKLLITLMAAVMLTGCSSTFTYNNLDWLLYWYLDDFIELDDQQKETFDGHLKGWLAWHRKEELKQYQSHLKGLQEKIQLGPMSREEVLEQYDLASQHWIRFRNHVMPELAELAVHLTDDQVVFLFDVLEKDNTDDEEDFAKLSDEEKAKDRVEDIQRQVKDYIGKLSKQQKSIIAEYSPQFRSNTKHWLAYRRAIQANSRELMLNHREDPDFVEKLRAIMLNPHVYRSEEYMQNREFNRQLNAQLMADISVTLTPKQKNRLNRKLKGFIEDLEDLIND